MKSKKDYSIKQFQNSEQSTYNTCLCKVISYNDISKVLAFSFKDIGCQIQIDNPKIENGYIKIKYKGKIGENFEFLI